jgi:hypothetical protein
MPAAQEIADFAVVCARDALDRLMDYIGGDEPQDNSELPEELLITSWDDRLGASDRGTWEHQAAITLAVGASAVLHPRSSATTRSDADSSKGLWRIQLIVESDDAGEVDRLGDAVVETVCGGHGSHADTEHACAIPWIVVTSPMSAHDADSWRDTLNR